VSGSRTLWEQGHRPSGLVCPAAATATLLAATLDRLLSGGVGYLFDIAFVLVCVASALSVRPGDFFAVGLLPPLFLTATAAVLAVAAPGWVARDGDGVGQALVSGLAHHSGALVTGYVSTLTVLGLRQVAARNAGTIGGGLSPGALRGLRRSGLRLRGLRLRGLGPLSRPQVAPQLRREREDQ
jgi:hypothetical protein